MWANDKALMKSKYERSRCKNAVRKSLPLYYYYYFWRQNVSRCWSEQTRWYKQNIKAHDCGKIAQNISIADILLLYYYYFCFFIGVLVIGTWNNIIPGTRSGTRQT